MNIWPPQKFYFSRAMDADTWSESTTSIPFRGHQEYFYKHDDELFLVTDEGVLKVIAPK